MGNHVNGPLTKVVAWACAILIVGLNIFLILQQL
jgi:Mn2+/Fe2+ NRAMP family transporter